MFSQLISVGRVNKQKFYLNIKIILLLVVVRFYVSYSFYRFLGSCHSVAVKIDNKLNNFFGRQNVPIRRPAVAGAVFPHVLQRQTRLEGGHLEIKGTLSPD
jgi:hypothetical protein